MNWMYLIFAILGAIILGYIVIKFFKLIFQGILLFSGVPEEDVFDN